MNSARLTTEVSRKKFLVHEGKFGKKIHSIRKYIF